MRAARRICGLIPARGGSKGIPRKNIKLLAGKPLIAWSIETALASRSLAAVVVTTEDEEIAEIARRLGASVPFLRPPELARDDTPMLDPVLHALDRLPEFDAVMLLQPTSPLRSTDDIDACARLARDHDAPSVVSVSDAPKHPHYLYRLTHELRMRAIVEGPPVARRQDLPPVYALNGALYLAQADWLRASRSFVNGETVAYVMPAERSVDLDTLLDWKLAELLIAERS